MKIIDQTPFFNNETGEISLGNRLKASMQFGAEWLKEVEGQREVMTVLSRVLDKSFTLLHNLTLPGLNAMFPLILVGPAGVFSMLVTPLLGEFRAKGDQWGSISGNAFKPEKINLLSRAELMGRALQIYLQRNTHNELLLVEPVLFCSNPSIHVDTIRPIIRVVMRDALERFAFTLMQARAALDPLSVHQIVDAIIAIPKPAGETPEEPAAAPFIPAPSTPLPAEETPAKTSPEPLRPVATAATSPEEFPASFPGKSESAPIFAAQSFTPIESFSTSPARFLEEAPPPTVVADTQPRAPSTRRHRLTSRQVLILILLFLLWCLLVAVFLILVFQDQGPNLLNLLP